jgi:hypothetical protein
MKPIPGRLAPPPPVRRESHVHICANAVENVTARRQIKSEPILIYCTVANKLQPKNQSKGHQGNKSNQYQVNIDVLQLRWRQAQKCVHFFFVGIRAIRN